MIDIHGFPALYSPYMFHRHMVMIRRECSGLLVTSDSNSVSSVKSEAF